MSQSKMRFLLVLSAFCVVFADAKAVPSVRVLGANNTGVKPVPAKTGDNINRSATVGTVKQASIKNAGVAQSAHVLSPSTNRIGTANASTTGRLPVISAKSIQTTTKPSASTVSSGAYAAKFDEVNERIDSLELSVKDKADAVDLDKYYTKDEINDAYYDSETIDEKLSEMGNLVSGNGDALTGISERLTQNESSVSELSNQINNQISNQINNLSERINGNVSGLTLMNNKIADVNARIDDINTISSVQYIQGVREKIAGYERTIEGYELQLGQMGAAVTDVSDRSKTIYDHGTESYKSVKIVDIFNPSVLTQQNNNTNNEINN